MEIDNQAASRQGGDSISLVLQSTALQPLMSQQIFQPPAPPKSQGRTRSQSTVSFGSNKRDRKSSSDSNAECHSEERHFNSKAKKQKSITTTNRLASLERENKALKRELATQKISMEKLMTEMEALVTPVTNLSATSPGTQQLANQRPLFSSVVSGKQTRKVLTPSEIDVLNAMNSERRDIDQRANNILIMGVPISDVEDTATVHKIFSILKVDKESIASVYRFKANSTSSHPPIIKVCLTTCESRSMVLKASKSLRSNVDLSKVYINPDLTFAQRSLEKSLIAERKALNLTREASSNPNDKSYYWGIRNGILKRIPITSPQ